MGFTVCSLPFIANSLTVVDTRLHISICNITANILRPRMILKENNNFFHPFSSVQTAQSYLGNMLGRDGQFIFPTGNMGTLSCTELNQQKVELNSAHF